jgi:hypothetical protein
MDLKAILMSKPAVNLLLMLSLKYFGIDPPLHPTRVLCIVCLTLHFFLLGLLYYHVNSGPEGKNFKAKEVDNDTQTCVLVHLSGVAAALNHGECAARCWH